MCDTATRLDGKVAIVTGGGSGFGLEISRNLANRGARVIIASRNETKLSEAVDDVIATTGNRHVAYRKLDLASLKSVRNFASETVNFEKRLDILVNNAGAVFLPDRLTDDGLILTLQVNYFGTFLLTFLLLPLLKASAPSRIVTQAAASMFIGEIDFDHWNDVGRYNLVTSIASCQLATTLFTAELDRRLNGTGVTANTYDPYVVRNTDLFNTNVVPPMIANLLKTFYNTVGLSKEEVGQQIAYYAAEPTLERVSGVHYKFCSKWLNHWLVNDEKFTRKVWDVSKQLVKITEEEDWEKMNIL